MESDDIAPLPLDPEEEVFEFGDQTICRMRRQPFDLAGNPADPDDLTSMVIRPLRPAVAAAPGPLKAGAADDTAEGAGELSTITIRPSRALRATHHAPDHDRLSRLEAKIDALSAAVESLQKVVDGIQEVLTPTR